MEDLHPEVLSRVLSHMDGPTLAAAGCASTLLRSLSSDPALWRRLCLLSWPSLHHPALLSLLDDAHHSFFSQSFPFPILDDETCTGLMIPDRLPTRILSAVDLHHNGFPIFSRVIDTDASSSWFLSSPFCLDALDCKVDNDPAPLPQQPVRKLSPEDLTLSWVVIDPETQHAVNMSSRQHVAIDRHWYTGDTLVRFALLLRGTAVSAVVTCGEEMGEVKEVRLTVEDADGVQVSGRKSLELLTAAMKGDRRETKKGPQMKEKYEEYVRKRRERTEKKARRERMLDLCCTGFGVLMFSTFIVLLAFK